jgi:hypothetical protein
MEVIPGFDDIAGKIVSQCGLVSGLLVIAVAWLALQLAKTRAAWEADRAAMEKLRESDRAALMKIIEDSSAAYENLAVSHAKLEGMLLAVQARGNGGRS